MYVRCGEWRHERHLSFTFSPTQGRGRLAATAEPQKNTQIHPKNTLKMQSKNKAAVQLGREGTYAICKTPMVFSITNARSEYKDGVSFLWR